MFLYSGRPYVVVWRHKSYTRSLNLMMTDIPVMHGALNKQYVKLLWNVLLE